MDPSTSQPDTITYIARLLVEHAEESLQTVPLDSR